MDNKQYYNDLRNNPCHNCCNYLRTSEQHPCYICQHVSNKPCAEAEYRQYQSNFEEEQPCKCCPYANGCTMLICYKAIQEEEDRL